MHSQTFLMPSKRSSSTITQRSILTMSYIKIFGRTEPNHISATKTKCTSSSRWTKKQSRGCSKKRLPTRILESKVLTACRAMHHKRRSKKKRTKKMLAKLLRDQQQATHCQVSERSQRLSTITSSLPVHHIQRTRLMRCSHAT